MIRDPIFLKKLQQLKEQKPRNYSTRIIDLWNDGKDSYQQEITAVGNILVVIKVSKGHEVYVQFNEIENSSVPLQEGIYLIDFYRFFLTFKHMTSAFGETSLLLLIGKDVIPVLQPTAVKQAKKVIADGERFVISSSDYDAYRHITSFSGLTQYNQLRGLIAWEEGRITFERNVRIKQVGIKPYYLYDFMVGKDLDKAEPFIIDLVGNQIFFEIWMEGLETNVSVYLYAEVFSV